MDGLRFRLRPIHVDDAEFLLGLRLRDGIREHVNATSHHVGDQRAWIDQSLSDPTDYSFVLENACGVPTGSFSIYDHDESLRRARIGRWLVQPGSRSVPEFALLGYSVCFGALGLNSVYCRIPSDNAAALAFQKRIGSVPCGESARVQLNGREVALLQFELASASWPAVADMLRAVAVAAHRSARRRERGRHAAMHAVDRPVTRAVL